MASVLIVEDDLMIAQMLRYFLEAAGYTVRIALTAQEARQSWTREAPDLAIVDIILPDGDGFGLVSELRGRSAQPVPAFLTSVLEKRECERRAQACGAIGFIPKPFEPALLANRLKSALAAP